MSSRWDGFLMERAIRERYAAAAHQREKALCCPVEYDPRTLAAIPREVLERDYGCGDPSRHVREGDTVLDLGSGGGKICFIASQLVGPKGRVIGVDENPEMLALASRAAPRVAEAIGYANVEFRRGRIEDLRLDLDRLDSWLAEHVVRDVDDLAALEIEKEHLRDEWPMVPDASVDIVISNCVLNLVRPSQKRSLVREMFRVLKPGGRIAISDIVSDEPVPESLQADPELWSGCVSGAFQEEELLNELEAAGFGALVIDQWCDEPFRVVEGIEFRSVTLTGIAGHDEPRLDAGQALIYRGPWKRVEDERGRVLVRGVRTAVCSETYRRLTGDRYAGQVVPVPPRAAVPEDERPPFDPGRAARRDPRETKGADRGTTRESPSPSGGCRPSCC